MLLRIWGVLLCFLAPTALFAELTRDECAQIERLVQNLPQECITTQAIANPVDGAPQGAAWQNHIFFPNGGSALDARATAKLQSLSRVLQGEVMGGACLQLIGHSDSSGGTAANQRVGQLRAEIVAEFLGTLLSNSTRIEERLSRGETQPLDDRPTTDKWQRRVEIRARHCQALG